MSRNAPRMDEIAIEGCRIRVRLDGSEGRPALLLAHMLGVDSTLWDALVPDLAQHFRVVRLDARGHGGSELGAGGFGVERLGRDMLAVLDHLGIARAHFCGLSMGGAVGLWLLAHAGQRIERAVIAGSAAKLGTPESWNERIAAARQGTEQALPATLERWFSRGFAEREPDKVERIAALIRGTDADGYAACCAALRDMDLREAVRGVANPVLVLRGVDDPTVDETHSRALVEAMENSTSQELGAKHCCCVEDEAGFLAAVVRFLTAKAAPRRAPARRVADKRGAAKETSPKPGARRLGGRGLTAARRPVARTAPVSKKAVAKAGATRKTAVRKTAARKPARAATVRAEPPRARATRAASRPAARAVVPKAAAKPAKTAAKPARTAPKPAAKAPAKRTSSAPSPKTVARKPASRATVPKKAMPVKALRAKAVAAKPAARAPGKAIGPASSKTAKPASANKPASAKTTPKAGKAKLSAAQLRARRGAPARRRKP